MKDFRGGGLFISMTLFLLPGQALAAEGGRVILTDNPAIQDGVLLVNPSARKLYAGRGPGGRNMETGFWVHDIDALGDISGSDERAYSFMDPALAASEKRENFLYVYSMALSTDARKLYLGLGGSPHDVRRGLVVQDLDEKGEPKGKPRSFDLGAAMEAPMVWCHPRLVSLFVYAPRQHWGCAVSLDKGEPVGVSPPRVEIQKGSITSLAADEAGSTLLLGVSVGDIQAVPLDSAGVPEPPMPQPFSFSKSPGTLKIARVGDTLYCASSRKLWAQPLNANAEPFGKPTVLPPWKALDVRGGTSGRLYAVLGEFAEDRPGADPVLTGVRLASFRPDAQGKTGEPLFLSEIYEGRTVKAWAVDDASGNIYASLATIQQ